MAKRLASEAFSVEEAAALAKMQAHVQEDGVHVKAKAKAKGATSSSACAENSGSILQATFPGISGATSLESSVSPEAVIHAGEGSALHRHSYIAEKDKCWLRPPARGSARHPRVGPAFQATIPEHNTDRPDEYAGASPCWELARIYAKEQEGVEDGCGEHNVP